MNFCVLGADARGTALSIHLIRQGHSVTLVPDSIDEAMAFASSRENAKHLPGYQLPLHLQIGFEVKPVLMEADVAIIAGDQAHLTHWIESVGESLVSAAALKLVFVLEDASSFEGAASMEDQHPGLAIGVISGLAEPEDLASGRPIALSLSGAANDEFLDEIETILNTR